MIVSRKRSLWIALTVGAVTALFLTIDAGPLEPPVPTGVPTMHPIDQVDPRIPIYPDSFPVTIAEPGSYYLTGSVSTSGNGIIIQTHDVTVDLMGFKLDGGTGLGIDGSSYDRITVRNGTIQGWSDTGVRLGNSAVVKDLIVRANLGNGIEVGYDALVVGCSSVWNNLHGIVAAAGSLVKDCASSTNTQNGIWINVPIASYGAVVTGCVVDQNSRNGIRVDGYVTVVGNHVHGNDSNGANGKAGIWVYGSYNRIEGNTVLNNNIGIDLDGSRNVIAKNTVGDSFTTNFDVGGSATANFMEIWTVGSPGSPGPWANVETP